MSYVKLHTAMNYPIQLHEINTANTRTVGDLHTVQCISSLACSCFLFNL